MSRIQAIIYVLIGASLYGLTGVITKFAYGEGFSANQVAAGQVLFGTLFLWFLAIKEIRILKYAARKNLLFLFLSGFFPTITTILYYIAIERLTASFAIILLFQFTWMGVVLESVKKKQFPHLNQWYSIILIFIGTILATGINNLELENLDLLGVMCGLLSAIGYTGFLYANGNIATELPSSLRSAWLSLGSFVMLWVMMPTIFTTFSSGAWTEGLWKWGIILGVTGAFIPSFLFAKAIPTLGADLASLLGSVELPVAILASAVVLKEEVDIFRWIGVLVILLGIWVAEFFGKVRPENKEKKALDKIGEVRRETE